MAKRRRSLKRTLLGLTVALFVTGGLVLSLEGGASFWTKWQASGALPPVKEVSHCVYDPDLGWRHAPSKSVPDLYGNGIGLTTNSQQLRGLGDYALEDSDDRYRILCLGDSFTMGYGVGDEDTFPALLSQQHKAIDTINMGLGGYGLGQCYMSYERDGMKFDVDVLLFAFIIGDFYRMNPLGNVADMGKPVLELVDGEPVAINTPVVNLLETPGIRTRLGRVWQTSELNGLIPKTLAAPAASANVNGQAFAPIALRIFEILRDQSEQRGQLFVLAMLPTQAEVPKKRLPIIDEWLKPELKKRGIPMIDLRPAFQKVPKSELPAHFTVGHYSRRGNLVAAKAMVAGVRALDPNCPR